MTLTTEFEYKGRIARISFVDEAVIVEMDQCRITIPNPRRRHTRRHKYWLCETHCARLCDRAAKRIEAWKLEREANDLEAMKDHAYA